MLIGLLTLAILSTFARTEKFNNGLSTHLFRLCGLSSSRLINTRCEYTGQISIFHLHNNRFCFLKQKFSTKDK